MEWGKEVKVNNLAASHSPRSGLPSAILCFLLWSVWFSLDLVEIGIWTSCFSLCLLYSIVLRIFLCKLVRIVLQILFPNISDGSSLNACFFGSRIFDGFVDCLYRLISTIFYHRIDTSLPLPIIILIDLISIVLRDGIVWRKETHKIIPSFYLLVFSSVWAVDEWRCKFNVDGKRVWNKLHIHISCSLF